MTATAIEETGVLNENDAAIEAEQIEKVHSGNENPDLPIVWKAVILHVFAHLVSLYGVYLAFTTAKWMTLLLLFFNYELGILGITAGSHRLWSHRSYKAKWPLRLFLAYCQSSLFHMDIVYWSRYHRLHHKYTETDIDPQNMKRGFFYAHMGWTIFKTTPQFEAKYKTVNVDDLYDDPIVVYQEKYYVPLMMLTCYIIPTLIPIYFWNETLLVSFCLNMLRYSLNLHSFFFVNSVTHKFGMRPYDKSNGATEHNAISYIVGGEGYHNYHHVFPWDYRASEYGGGWSNTSTAFINFMSKIGLAYDLKTVSRHLIENRVKKSGDGSHSLWGLTEARVKLLDNAAM